MLSRLWARCAQIGRLPTHDETTAAKALLEDARLAIGLRRRTRPSACRTARSVSTASPRDISSSGPARPRSQRPPGVRGLLLNVGGDLRVRGEYARTIGIAAPWARLRFVRALSFYIEVKDRSVATSGKSRRGFQINDKWYSHVFDPRTARPVERVIARDGGRRTRCRRRRPRQDLRRARARGEPPAGQFAGRSRLPDPHRRRTGRQKRRLAPPGTAARPSGARHGSAARYRSVKHEHGRSTKTADQDKIESKASPRPAWNKEFELLVNFEINHPEAEKGRYRRPYVAVWVEDTEGKAGAHAGALGLDGRIRSVSMAPRPQALV